MPSVNKHCRSQWKVPRVNLYFKQVDCQAEVLNLETRKKTKACIPRTDKSWLIALASFPILTMWFKPILKGSSLEGEKLGTTLCLKGLPKICFDFGESSVGFVALGLQTVLWPVLALPVLLCLTKAEQWDVDFDGRKEMTRRILFAGHWTRNDHCAWLFLHDSSWLSWIVFRMLACWLNSLWGPVMLWAGGA